jgi:hypothetical protein
VLALWAAPALASTSVPDPAPHASELLAESSVDALATADVDADGEAKTAKRPPEPSSSGFTLEVQLSGYRELFPRSGRGDELLPIDAPPPLRLDLELPSLPETRIRASRLFALYLPPASNRTSRESATGFALGLLANRVGDNQSFLSEDPFAGVADTPPSLHRYTYAHVNPTVYTDPTGMAVGDWWDVRSYADGELWRKNAHDLWNLASLGTLERVQRQSDLGTWRGALTSLDIAGEQIVNAGSLGLSQNLLARVEETGTLGAGDVWAAASTTAYQLTPIDEIRQVAQEHDQMSGGEIAVALSLAVSKSAGLAAGVRAATAPRAAVTSAPRINLAGARSEALTAGAQRAAAARAAARSAPTAVKAAVTIEASTAVSAEVAAAEVTRSVPAVVDGGMSGATGPPPRPTWQTAQAGPASNLEGFGFTPEPSYLGGQRVPYGTRGSVRPDYASELMELSVDVKNYAVETPQGRWRLVNDIVGQTSNRAANLPPGMRQGVVIDIRGQSVSDLLLQRMIDRIVKKSNGLIEPENIVIQR